LKTFRPKPVALVIPGHRRLAVCTEDGERLAEGKRAVEQALAYLEGHVVYVPRSLQAMKYTTGATSWTLSTWRGRETRMTYNPTGLAFTSLRGVLEESTEPWQDLQTCLRWLRGYGVAPASLSSMAWSLWRASLPGEVTIGFDPDIGRSALFGGRQEISEPREYAHMVSADIRAAYPFSMASGGDYALSLRSVSPQTVLDPSVAGLARCRVVVPTDLPYAPLPVRIAPQIIQFQRGMIRGTWPWRELAAARELGCEVSVDQCWAPRRTADLFGSWWPIAQEGRRLPGAAAMMAKSILNSLWGQFGMVGDDRAEIRWTDDKGETPYNLPLEERKMPHEWTAHIAAETTGRVRTRTLTEGMYGSTYRPVHVDTDGIIVRRSAPVPSPAGDAPGQWRVKERMARVQIKAPQLYRFTCGKGCGVTHIKWHHVASGVGPGAAPEFWRRQGQTGTGISHLARFDTCLPPGHHADVERNGALRSEAYGLGVA
jgi:hypothetical protein